MQNSCEEQPVYLAVLWGRREGCGWLSPLLMHNRDFDKRQQEEGKILHGGTKIDRSVCVALWTRQVWPSYDRQRGCRVLWSVYIKTNWTFIVFVPVQITAKEIKRLCWDQQLVSLYLCISLFRLLSWSTDSFREPSDQSSRQTQRDSGFCDIIEK